MRTGGQLIIVEVGIWDMKISRMRRSGSAGWRNLPGMGKTDFPDLFGEGSYNRYSLTAALDEGTRLVCGRIKEFSGVFFRDENYSAIGRED